MPSDEDVEASLDEHNPARTELNRRELIRASLGSGLAAAVLPLQAQTQVKTGAEGLVVGEVSMPIGAHKLAAYRAAPAGKAQAPVVLVVSEIFGVHAYIADVARRLARRGYFAIAPELFERQGDAGSYGEVAKLIAEVVNRTPDAQVMADLDACVAWAAGQGADTTRLGITGFCWGGRITWLYAAHSPAVKAGVAWYGRLVGEKNALQPAHPVDVAARLHAPVLGLYGGADTGIPIDSVGQMKRSLAAGSAPARASRFVVYPKAPHAFHADYRPSYRQADAQDGWRRCIDWFAAQGVA